MASLEAVQAQFQDQLTNLGKAGLHALFPKDFTYSMMSMELVDSRGTTIDFFTWPVLPDEVSETHNELTTIRKTFGGVNVNKTPSFTPVQISMRGTFGRTFKLLINNQAIEFMGFGFSIRNGRFNISKPNLLQGEVPQFSSFAKTGYGCVKILESMKNKSKQLDKYNKPHSLFLYNSILGTNYMVEVNSFRHWQDKDQYNMIPGYSMQLTAVAELNSLFGRLAAVKSTLKNLTLGNLQKGANAVASQLRLIPGL